MSTHYVYVYSVKKKPIYVGIGKHNEAQLYHRARAKSGHESVSLHHIRYTTRIVADQLTEKDARLIESLLIREFKRAGHQLLNVHCNTVDPRYVKSCQPWLVKPKKKLLSPEEALKRRRTASKRNTDSYRAKLGPDYLKAYNRLQYLKRKLAIRPDKSLQAEYDKLAIEVPKMKAALKAKKPS